MKPKEIQELIDFISKSGLDEVNIETEAFKIKVKKNSEPKSKQVIQLPTAAAPAPVAAAPVQAASVPAAPAAPAQTDSSENLTEVKSPMIGTFYRASNPDAPNFANVGDRIEVGQTVCIIEAMKLFNEIESEISGTIVKVLVENASPVEYDQPLFLIDTSA